MIYKITFIKDGTEPYFWEVMDLSLIITDLIKVKLAKGYYCKIEKL